MSVLALDFDGVLCDSARETGITGWKAAGELWRDMSSPLPPQVLLDRYCSARPVIETGFEAIAMMRLLQDGEDPRELLENFAQLLPATVARTGMDAAGLKRLYGTVRDRWIQEDAEGWLSLSPLYAGTTDALNSLPPDTDCYIVTTKQERFVGRLLKHNGVRFAADHIYGLDRGMAKETVLRQLLDRHSDRRIHFVEDRLATLKRLLAQPDLSALQLHIACWGYNTEADCREAQRLNIDILNTLNLNEITCSRQGAG